MPESQAFSTNAGQNETPKGHRDSAPKATRILAIANQKGGVGKTTTTVNLGTALAAVGRNVLVVDLDPQANATTGLGFRPDSEALNSYDVLLGNTAISEAVLDTEMPRLQLVPTTVHLSGAEVELVAEDRREYRLKQAFQHRVAAYDYVLIDCPPALGFLTLNALVAANAVLVPLQCEYYALEGVSHLVRTINRVKQAFNQSLTIQGVVLTMYDRRNNLCQMVVDDVRQAFGDMVYETIIPRNVRVAEAPSHGKPVLLYAVESVGAQAYAQLAGELLRREHTARARST